MEEAGEEEVVGDYGRFKGGNVGHNSGEVEGGKVEFGDGCGWCRLR